MPDYNFYRRLGDTVINNGLLAYFARLGISDAELVVIIQLEAFRQRGDFFPSNEKIASNTNLTVADAGILLQNLVEKDCLSIQQLKDDQGRISNRYSLDPLFKKLDEYMDENVQVKSGNGEVQVSSTENDLDNDPLNKLAREFEIEFGRYLTPIEREEIADWLNLDHYSPAVIKMALREAVLSQALSFKYVDRVLLNWQRQNLKTPEDVQRFLERNR